MASVYREIISLLKMHGSVVTEHVGDEGEISRRDMDLSDREIHDRDLQWIRESDMVVAEVTMPSLGVGYEIGRAVELAKPILCLYNSCSKKNLSAMVAGSESVSVHTYLDPADLDAVLSGFIAQHAPRRTS